VEQRDRRPKRVFVLGVQASAVHARCVGPDGNDVVKALAVASEPRIFWRGDGAEDIISRISLPTEIGSLKPAEDRFNGPSGRALDDPFLKPLGVDRHEAWLCDLVRHSCMNAAQRRVIERWYMPLCEKSGLPVPSVPPLPDRLADEARRRAILHEIREPRASVLVLLGDQPIPWFLRFFGDRWRRLSDFGATADSYGWLHRVGLSGMVMKVLPLAHPRQAARPGRSSISWFDLHQRWVRTPGDLLS